MGRRKVSYYYTGNWNIYYIIWSVEYKIESLYGAYLICFVAYSNNYIDKDVIIYYSQYYNA